MADIKLIKKCLSYIKILRPKQWIKNAFVLAGLVFSGNMFHLYPMLKVLAAFLLFCAASGCVYIINDLVDIERDKVHPQKRRRPLASGAISKLEAILLFVLLITTTFILSGVLEIKFLCVLVLYFVINLLYSFILKHVLILDVMTIAAGFVLRAVAGAVVINVQVSPWLLICTIFISLFLGFSKRKNEVETLKGNAAEHRAILGKYTPVMVDQMLSSVTACTLMSYALYTVYGAKSIYMMATIVFVIYGIFRYQYLSSEKGMGGAPEMVLLKDLPLIVDILLWGISVLVIQYWF